MELTDIQTLFPARNITQDDLDLIAEAINDSNEQLFLGSLIQFKDTITNSPYTLKDLICALRFTSYVSGGLDFVNAFKKAFAFDEKIQQLILENKSKTLRTMANQYAKNKLVLQILKELDYPLDLLYAGYRHQAVEALRNEMLEAKSSRDRINAADKLLEHLKPNLEQNIMISFGEKKAKTPIDIYQEALKELANQQLRLIENKEIEVKEIINVDIIQEENKDN